MKSDLDCLACLLRQAVNTVRIATDDPEHQREVLNQISRLIPSILTGLMAISVIHLKKLMSSSPKDTVILKRSAEYPTTSIFY